MTSSSVQAGRTHETQFLERLGGDYAKQGFTFIVQPRRTQLPDFLGSYRPDAIAQKPGVNIAIEVKQHNNLQVQRSLRSIRKLFDGHPDWHLAVAYIGSDPLDTLEIGAAQPATIHKRMDEVAALASQGHRSAAFIIAWSLLEAVSRRVDGRTPSRPRTAGTVVQTLAMLGYVEHGAEQRLQELVDLRNRIVHGDLDAEPAQADIELMLSVVSNALLESAA